jgi:hypothetical protein
VQHFEDSISINDQRVFTKFLRHFDVSTTIGNEVSSPKTTKNRVDIQGESGGTAAETS